jgi:hypothetical protein
VVALVLLWSGPGQAQVVPESRLKAAIVSKLPQFVEWPTASTDTRSSLDICVASPDPFGADLTALVADEAVGQRRLATRIVASPADVATCHVLFLPSHGTTPHPLLAAALNRPILTVGDSPRFLDEGGIIALRVIDGRVRFDIDDIAARRVGLKISSQLLRLAVNVRGGGS